MATYVFQECSRDNVTTATTVSQDNQRLEFHAFDPGTCRMTSASACVVPQIITANERLVPTVLSLLFCLIFFIVTGLSRFFYKRGSDKCQCFNYVWFTFDHVLSSVVLATIQVGAC